MTRSRISTTVDAITLERARALVGTNDAAMLDRALHALISEVESEKEIAALRDLPYDSDADLALPAASPATDLPYDGDVPTEILEIARRRRSARRR
jgi:hypothetical protein